MAVLGFPGVGREARSGVRLGGLTERITKSVTIAFAWSDGRPRTSSIEEVELEPGETVLGGSEASMTGEPVLLSDRALYFRSHRAEVSRIGWECVEQVNASTSAGTMSLTCIAPHRPASVVLHLGEAALLDTVAALARDRVQSTILHSQYVRLRSGVPARLTARRRPGSGTVVWHVELPEHASSVTARLDSDVQHAISEMRATAGV